jgi:hypothetical protein
MKTGTNFTYRTAGRYAGCRQREHYLAGASP